MKAATSAHSVAEVIPFFSVFNIRFESNVSIKPKENIFYTQKNISVHSCFNLFVPRAKDEQSSHASHKDHSCDVSPARSGTLNCLPKVANI